MDQLTSTLLVFSGLIFVGGLARISSGSASLLFSGDIIGPFVAELVMAPLLGWWIYRATRRAEPT